jgi:hypothetical protein
MTPRMWTDQLRARRAARLADPNTPPWKRKLLEASLSDEAQPTKPTRKINIPDNVTPDTMLRLEAAAALGFPDGSMSVAALRREAAAGRLAVYAIAGKHFTTLADIQEMKTSCRVQARGQGSHCSKPKAGPRSGTSETGNEPSALAALKATAQRLKENLPPTSPANTTPEPASAAVIPMRSK